MGQANQYSHIIEYIKSLFPGQDFIPLHEPRFTGNEKKYVTDAIDSTFVSSVGAYVNRFEEMMQDITGAKYAVATVNGTSALHMALIVAGVKQGDEVLSQDLTFIATANAISYIGAHPVFLDIDRKTLGLSADKLEAFLQEHGQKRETGTINKRTGRRIAACVPMHTYGLPCEIDKIAAICKEWQISLVEDAAESLGSYYKGRHTGGFGLLGTFSFNGNKTVTCGGGGAIVTDNEQLAKLAKHLTTQAKVPHAWEFNHDHVGYNYRMPNLNAALACAQLEQLNTFVDNKRDLAEKYKNFFSEVKEVRFCEEGKDARANYWLNALLLENRAARDAFLEEANSNGVMSRPAWTLMHKLPMFRNCQHDDVTESELVADRLVNVPSSVRIER
ncbi:aminotransferase in exopolysaccharide biosynthesis [Pontibacter ummariensis]|uniref:GDP-perosamine synthase n=1 Tax=Pontibacter ummariensis TaxID=1610492 RepID=A0A239EJ81_9BACT|nr:LegC family aminotransferase [Pontibacter ummariensis]PRY13290.1 aminotransferase in exopolysaccharide biosynthesis [Pontibacter ummariensis]SNS44706.1 aminotransferase, LLPSF_NHT_00031 family [Pontibacter ummariensis]